MTTSDTIAGKIIGASKTKVVKLPHHEQMQKLSCGLARLIRPLRQNVPLLLVGVDCMISFGPPFSSQSRRVQAKSRCPHGLATLLFLEARKTPAAWRYSQQSVLPHPSSATSPLIGALAHSRNRRTRDRGAGKRRVVTSAAAMWARARACGRAVVSRVQCGRFRDRSQANIS